MTENQGTQPPRKHDESNLDSDRQRGTVSEAELLEAVNGGSRDALVALFLRNKEAFLRFGRRFERSHSSADDIISETITKMLTRIDAGELGHIHAFRPYFTRAMRNTGIDMERRAAHETATDIVSLAPHLAIDDSSDLLADSALITAAFTRLPENWRQVLWHTEVLDESPEETSKRLGITKGALAILKFRAREGLRQAYLAEHLNVVQDPDCRMILELLPKYVRGKLHGPRLRQIDAHLVWCSNCPLAAAQLKMMNTNLSGVLAPALIVSGAHQPADRALAGWVSAVSTRRVILAAATLGTVGAAGLVALALQGRGEVLHPHPASLHARAPSPRTELSPTVPPASLTPPPRPVAPATPTSIAALPEQLLPTAAASSSPSAPASSAPPSPELINPSTTTEHLASGSVVTMIVNLAGSRAQRTVLVLSAGPLASFEVLGASWDCTTLRTAPAIRVQCQHISGESLRFTTGLTMASSASHITASIRLRETGQAYSINVGQ